jgi:uncharacterized protein YfdQ (DUF2303 family)
MPQFNDSVHIGDNQAAIAVGAAIGDPRIVVPTNEGVYAVVPKDYEIQNLEGYLPKPLRIRQHVTFHDTNSFIEYLKAYATQSATRLFFATEGEAFEAVIDYHETSDTPGWCTHIASFKPAKSVEFATWMDRNKKQFTQVDFARFLEENLPDVVEPTGAELLEVALTMEAKKEVTFSSGVRLANGQIQFQYDEEVRGTAKKGTLEIPEQFVLGIAIHENGPAYRIPVRLRWRLHEGKAIFWYEIVRPHRFVQDAIQEIRSKVTTDTGYPVLTGVPR